MASVFSSSWASPPIHTNTYKRKRNWANRTALIRWRRRDKSSGFFTCSQVSRIMTSSVARSSWVNSPGTSSIWEEERSLGELCWCTVSAAIALRRSRSDTFTFQKQHASYLVRFGWITRNTGKPISGKANYKRPSAVFISNSIFEINLGKYE